MKAFANRSRGFVNHPFIILLYDPRMWSGQKTTRTKQQIGEDFQLTNRVQGFTLIELAIVLVIIGLLVGGILVGRDLIHASEIHATLSQLDKYKAAINTFKLKYNCLPGDCSQATNLGLVTDATYGNGNGDGVISMCNNALGGVQWPTYYSESYNVWYHLESAKLIDANVTGLFTGGNLAAAGKLPPARIGNNNYIGAGTFNYAPSSSSEVVGNALFISSGTVTSNGGACTYLCDGGMTASDAYAFDSKIDDGLPFSGKVRQLVTGGNPSGAGPSYYTYNIGAAVSGVRGCSTNAANAYDIAGNWFGGNPDSPPNPNRLKCALVFAGGF